MRNQEIIRKAEMSLATLKSGGLMNPAQASAFIRMVQNTPTIFSESRVIQMENDSQKFEKIGFGQRILRAADEGKALAKDQLTAPVTSTVELNAKEVIAEVNITYDTLENNIEKDGLQQTLMQMLAERAAVDIEELIVNGDVASSDPYLAQLDGIRKQSVSHIVDAGGEQISRQLFKQGLKAVPAKYMRVPQEFRFFTSLGQEIEWKDRVAERQTTLGDAAVQGGLSTAFGVPVKGVSNIQPYAYGEGDAVAEASDIILTHPKNIILGFSRNIRIEVDKDIRARKFIIVLTAKLDSKFEEEDAVAKIINVKE
ncbi:phage major capsid protein [Bacillus licheniformis]|uniref:phage major capsid protein n=1 Tax=Bacillus licheniformis TaxID=1402 RepID=UPI0011A70358|nr:phage major capsid protein [Bacillus licheniformis]TWJ36028.1 Phage-like element PBSX protein XkdG [Bacillus licheniformis]